MADTIDGVLQEQRSALLNNLLKTNQELYLNKMSNSTKERLIKEVTVLQIDSLMTALNNEFEDVHFDYSFGRYCSINNNFQPFSYDRWDFDYTDDSEEENFDSLYNDFDYGSSIFDVDIASLEVKINYFWERTCSLGCKHRTKRYYIVNMAKLLDILAFWQLNPPVRTLVKEYIPDFFYDVTPVEKPIAPEPVRALKKKRGRKPLDSSCKL